MSWPLEWDRSHVRGAIEEASGVALSLDDSLPDSLIAKAQELGLGPTDLKLWIYDSPGHPWTMENLEAWWQRANRIPHCGHCGEPVDDPGNHECNGRQACP